MDIESVRRTLQQADLASLGVGFGLGFVFTFNPVGLASIPVSLACVTRARGPKEATVYSGMFVLGMLFTQSASSASAGSKACPGFAALIGSLPQREESY